MNWYEAPPILEHHGHVIVAREDLLEGGAKMRFLPFLVAGAREVVYGTPFCGGAQVALSVWGKKTGTRITLFTAKRGTFHRRQRMAFENGARIFQVPYGYMTNVQAKARAYAKDHGALFLPLGFDVPEAAVPFVRFLRSVRERVGRVDEVWCATGSGMLARCLGEGFPDATVHGVVVGLKSKNEKQSFGRNVVLHQSALAFQQEAPRTAPFPACPNYEQKAWELCAKQGRGQRLFWNVLS